jgi:hypothetical protein
MASNQVNLIYNVKGYYVGAKASIEALAGVPEGSIGYATDTDEFGSYNGTVWTWGTGGGPINTGTLDARYLKLDTSNNPLTGELQIFPPDGTDGLDIRVAGGNRSPMGLVQTITGTAVVANPAVYVERVPVPGFPSIINGYQFDVEDKKNDSQYAGGAFRYKFNNTDRLHLNPNLTGSASNYLLDTSAEVPYTGTILQVNRFGTRVFHVDPSGTARSNNEPLIKEAPTNDLPYIRRNAGWETAPTGTYGNFIRLNGWEPDSNSWVRTGNHTFLVSGNHTGTYSKGTKIMYDEGAGDEFGVVGSYTFTSGSVTTVNLIPNTNYTMAGNPTSRYYSYIENPDRFPAWFNFTSPTVTGEGAMTWSTSSTIHASWRPTGRDIEVSFFLIGTVGGTPNKKFYVAPPIAVASPFTSAKLGVTQVRDAASGNSVVGSGFIDSTNGVNVYKQDDTNWTTGASRILFWNGSYPY